MEQFSLGLSHNRLRRTREPLGSSSIHKTDEKERNDYIDNQETEELPVSEAVPALKKVWKLMLVTEKWKEDLLLEIEICWLFMQKQLGKEQILKEVEQHLCKWKLTYNKLDDEWITGPVLGQASKVSGKYKTWYNIQNENGKERSAELERHEREKLHETKMTDIANKQKSESEEIVSAKVNEIEKLVHFDTYEEVNDRGQKVVSKRWVITNKNGQTKARLVVRGFEEKDLPIYRDSLTVGKGAMRLLISIAALKNWTLKPSDIKYAFLKGKELEREIYIKPPKESKTPQHLIFKL